MVSYLQAFHFPYQLPLPYSAVVAISFMPAITQSATTASPYLLFAFPPNTALLPRISPTKARVSRKLMLKLWEA